MREWHYIVENKEQGPVQENDLVIMLSNGQLPPDTMVWMQEMTDWVQADQVEELISAVSPPPPVALTEPTVNSEKMTGHKNVLASRWKRLWGSLLDSLISMMIIVPLMLVTGAFQRAFSGEAMGIGQQAMFFVVGWVVFLMLNGYLLANRGQTIGKVIVKTKIVDLNGDIPCFGKLLVFRYLILGLVAQIPFIGGLVGIVNALFIFGQDRRCLHDYMAGTQVVEA